MKQKQASHSETSHKPRPPQDPLIMLLQLVARSIVERLRVAQKLPPMEMGCHPLKGVRAPVQKQQKNGN